MLSPEEFTVGSFVAAKPMSLILPRTRHEGTALIGTANGKPVAVFLGGDHAFTFFDCDEGENWHGLIVPNVRIEVDEATVFDPAEESPPLGYMVRTEARLAIKAQRDRAMSPSHVTLYEGLATASLRAGFRAWQVVVGEGLDKRVLWTSKPA